MNKKILLLIIVGMFLVAPLVSADLLGGEVGFDNVIGEYNETTHTATITNTFGLGGDIAELKLLTPLNYKVPIGYQKVAEIEIQSFTDYSDALDELKFYDVRNDMEEINRDFDYKYKTIEQVEVNDYGEICGFPNGNNTICNWEIVGTHFEDREVWLDYETTDFTENQNITIGIFTDVQYRDKIEWIPKYMGVEINEWATWEAEVVDAHGTGSIGTSSGTHPTGVTIFNKNDVPINITIVTKSALCTANTCAIMWMNGTNLTRASFVGNDCYIGNISIPANTPFQVSADSGAVSFTRDNFGTFFPLAGTNINWTGGSLRGVTDPSSSFNIKSITTAKEYQITFSLNSPINNSNFIVSAIDFNATITSTDLKNVTMEIWEINNNTLEFSDTNSSGIAGNYIWNDVSLGDGYYNWSISAFDNSDSRFSSESKIFTIAPFFEQNYFYDSEKTEVSPATIIAKIKSRTLTSAHLQYNNTNYSVSINSLGGGEYNLSSTITTPLVGADTNVTWFFWINGENLTAYNQTILNINLDDCSSYGYFIVNYTLVGELDQVKINNTNSTIESLVNLKTIIGGEVAQFNNTWNGTATASVCSEINLNSSGLKLWEQSRYGSTDHVYEQHNIQNASMTSLPREITLRILPSTSATTFRIAYKSSTFLPVENAVIDIQRKYIGEGLYKTIEAPLTDTSGETSASLDLNSVLYRIVVSKNGIVLAIFENPAVVCDNLLTGDCSIIINERSSIILIDSFDILNNFDYGLYEENRTITLIFEIPNGENSLVNLFVNQSTILGNQTSCNQTLFASSGQVQCVIDNALGDVYVNVYVYSDGVLIRHTTTTILEDRSQYFGTDHIVLTFFLVLSLILMMVSSPIALLIGILLGLIASGLLLFLNAGDIFGVAPVLTYVVIIVIILIIKISGRER